MVNGTGPTWGLIGVGSMGEAVLRLALESGWPRSDFVVTHRRPQRRAQLIERYGVPVKESNLEAAATPMVVACVRPQEMRALLDEISPGLQPGQAVVSLAAALDLHWLRTCVPTGVAIIRAHPPPATTIRSGTAFLAADHASAVQRALVERLLSHVASRQLWIDDGLIDLAVAIGPSLTPYLRRLLRELIALGVQGGLSPEQAEEIVRIGLVGAADTFDPILDGHVATRGGLAEAALIELESQGAPAALRAAALAMLRRCEELRGGSQGVSSI